MHLVEPRLGRLDLPGALFADDLPLGLDLVHIETRQRHPVGLDLQRQLPVVRRKHEPEVRAVLAGLGVRLPPRDERELVDLALRESFGPLEQHVFEEVRQPRLARRLVARADRIEEVADDDGYLPARQDQGAEAVVQNSLEYRQIADPGSRGAGLESSSHVRTAPGSPDGKRTSSCPAPAASRKQRRASGPAEPTPARMRPGVPLCIYCIIGRRQIQDPFPGERPRSSAVLVICNSGLFRLWWIGYDNDMRLCRCVAFREWRFLKRKSATRPCHAKSES